MSSYLVTGASRGLGLAMVSHLITLPPTEVAVIFASTRSDSSKLEEIAKKSNARVHIIKLDVGVKQSVEEAASAVEQKLQGKGLDYLINNAAIGDYSPNGLMDGMESLNEVFNNNVTSVHMITQAFLPLIRLGERKAVINISTTLGSFKWVHHYQPMVSPAYSVTKAALNMLSVNYAYKLKDEGITVVVICPGWLKTDMGTQNADLTVEVGAEKVLDVVHKTEPSMNGKFFNIHVPGWEEPAGLMNHFYDGKELGW